MIDFSYCLAQCYDDPDLFNTQILGRNPYWTRQREIANSVVRYRDTVVYSGNAVGKDYVVAGMIHWWLFTRPNSMVVVTAPGQTLLGSVIWKEVRRALETREVPLDAKISTACGPRPRSWIWATAGVRSATAPTAWNAERPARRERSGGRRGGQRPGAPRLGSHR